MCVHNCSRVRRLNCTRLLFRLSYAISAKKCPSKCRLGCQRACCASLEAKRVGQRRQGASRAFGCEGCRSKLLLLIRIAPEHPFPLQVWAYLIGRRPTVDPELSGRIIFYGLRTPPESPRIDRSGIFLLVCCQSGFFLFYSIGC